MRFDLFSRLQSPQVCGFDILKMTEVRSSHCEGGQSLVSLMLRFESILVGRNNSRNEQCSSSFLSYKVLQKNCVFPNLLQPIPCILHTKIITQYKCKVACKGGRDNENYRGKNTIFWEHAVENFKISNFTRKQNSLLEEKGTMKVTYTSW